MDKAESLKQIITFGKLREEAFIELVKFGYDNKTKLTELTDRILANVLTKYLSGSITADELEEWANFIECRDDINYSKLEGYIYALANPVVMGDINKDKIAKMLRVLVASSSES